MKPSLPLGKRWVRHRSEMKRLRRDRLKVYMDILSTIRTESRKERMILTHVQQKSNVPFDRLKTYISELLELGLIQDEAIPKLTEKGVQYINEYEKVLDFMKRMGLTFDETKPSFSSMR